MTRGPVPAARRTCCLRAEASCVGRTSRARPRQSSYYARILLKRGAGRQLVVVGVASCITPPTGGPPAAGAVTSTGNRRRSLGQTVRYDSLADQLGWWRDYDLPARKLASATVDQFVLVRSVYGRRPRIFCHGSLTRWSGRFRNDKPQVVRDGKRVDTKKRHPGRSPPKNHPTPNANGLRTLAAPPGVRLPLPRPVRPQVVRPQVAVRQQVVQLRIAVRQREEEEGRRRSGSPVMPLPGRRRHSRVSAWSSV
jgi:hypothetical protein